KDSIIEGMQTSHIAGSAFAQFAVMASVFVTAFYAFRMYFLVFHGKENFGKSHAHDEHGHHGLAPGQKPHETSWVITVPLILLAIPSVFLGYFTIGPMLHGEFFQGAIFVSNQHATMHELSVEFNHMGGALGMALHSLTSLPCWLALAGVVCSYWFY